MNPSYGTIDDFQQFLDAAHARNMQVMIELVINHTSDQHPWFQAARRAPKGSPEREMYVWSDTDKLYEGVRIIFTDTEKIQLDLGRSRAAVLLASLLLAPAGPQLRQPARDGRSPHGHALLARHGRRMRLRLDAIPYLVERDGTSCENVPETHVKIKQIRAVIDAEYENRLILAEANMWPADVRPYFGDGDECHMAFHFPLMPRIYMALRQEDRLPITDIMAQTPEIPRVCQWGLFLRNHDELTLEMVTDEERDYMNMAYAADPRMRINVGIRRRLAPLVDNNRRRIELLNSLLFSFPGTPIMYYGDEIGMGDNIYLGDRNGVRTPMQWNPDRNAGFSKAVPAKLYFPVIMDPVWGYQAINVEAQQADPSSLLHWTRNMIALRKLFQVFGRGTLEFLHPENRKVLAYIREYQREDGSPPETVLCVANLSRFAQPVALDLSKYVGSQPVEMLGYVPFPEIRADLYPVTLAPYSFLWLELQPPVPRPEPPVVERTSAAGRKIEGVPLTPAPALSLASLLAEPEQETLRTLLPQFLTKQRWFGSKSQRISDARVVSSAILNGTSALMTMLEVSFEDGPAELYQLPLAVATGEQAASIHASSPGAILATFEGDDTAILYDASTDPEFRHALLENIIADSGEENGNGGAGQLSGEALQATRSQSLNAAELENIPSRLGSAEQSNTSILYGEIAILKLFRRIRTGENPDVEVTRFLTEVAHFQNIPAYLGDLHRASDRTTLAFLQAFASNQGDGWAWTIAELGLFYESVSNCPPPAIQGPPLSFAAAAPDPPEAREHAALYLDAARLLGQRTAELHLALATPTDNPAFSAQRYTEADLQEDRDRIGRQVTAGFDALAAAASGPLRDSSEWTRSAAERLLSQRDAELSSLAALGGDPTRFGSRIRIHGDYHLGQLLRSRSDFLIVDFEGEPARPLAERRRKQSPLRDVAGMLRSFSYAARSALDRHLQRHPEQGPALLAWASLWENSSCNAFLRGYRETMAARPDLLPGDTAADLLLRALLQEKAFYELLYELNNRPTWLHIPLAGLLSLQGSGRNRPGIS